MVWMTLPALFFSCLVCRWDPLRARALAVATATPANTPRPMPLAVFTVCLYTAFTLLMRMIQLKQCKTVFKRSMPVFLPFMPENS